MCSTSPVYPVGYGETEKLKVSSCGRFFKLRGEENHVISKRNLKEREKSRNPCIKYAKVTLK
jgi:hypothetical protein